ncbi:hypothetical protein [Ottowia thiooxydans]|uniref:hypothetical protein n=1 Tax=Ottowia thiooxydans TaxID=219182 RepID=UPI000411F5A6|nr:hypothetical protein [Ottowia thiooxydans]
MTWQRILTLLAAIALGAGAWRAGGWAGIALVGSALVLWFLLNYTRLITIMKRAADQPIGYVGSAVMFNVKLRPKLPLLHVIGMTRSLGERLSAEGVEPEVYLWRDPGDSQVICEFEGGRLARWRLERPTQAAENVESGEASGKPE